MRRAIVLASVLLLGLCGTAPAEQLTIALSTPDVKIDSNFTGTAVTVFGVIQTTGPSVLAAGASYQVAVIVRGPGENVVARRKDRFLGIWVNSDSETFIAAPSFYAVSTSSPLAAFATPAHRSRLEIGYDNISFTYAHRAGPNDPGADPYRDAFLRLKGEAGLYTQQTGVHFIASNIFRTTVWIPANVPVGRYRVSAVLFANDAPIATATDWIAISKTGFEQYMFTISRREALLYGLATVLLALFTGWLAGVIFRRD
jgi:uncharacterized protein (TIGR02186 family)